MVNGTVVVMAKLTVTSSPQARPDDESFLRETRNCQFRCGGPIGVVTRSDTKRFEAGLSLSSALIEISACRVKRSSARMAAIP